MTRAALGRRDNAISQKIRASSDPDGQSSIYHSTLTLWLLRQPYIHVAAIHPFCYCQFSDIAIGRANV